MKLCLYVSYDFKETTIFDILGFHVGVQTLEKLLFNLIVLIIGRPFVRFLRSLILIYF